MESPHQTRHDRFRDTLGRYAENDESKHDNGNSSMLSRRDETTGVNTEALHTTSVSPQSFAGWRCVAENRPHHARSQDARGCQASC